MGCGALKVDGEERGNGTDKPGGRGGRKRGGGDYALLSHYTQ